MLDDELRHRLIQHHPEHQPAPADLGDTGDLRSCVDKQLPLAAHLGEEVLVDGLKHGPRGGAGDGVAAEGGAVRARGKQLRCLATGDGRADGQSPAQPFGHGDHVRQDAFVLKGKKVAGAADAGLDLVGDEEDAVGVAKFPHRCEETFWCGDDPRFALDGLQDDRGGVARVLLHQGPECLDVAVGEELDASRHGFERCALVRLARQRERAHGAAVEAALSCENAAAAGQAREFEGGLVGLGAGVAEKHPRGVVADPGAKCFGHLHYRLGAEEVGHVPQARHLRADRVHNGRMRVAERVDGDAGEHVDVGVALRVRDRAALAGDKLHRWRGVGV